MWNKYQIQNALNMDHCKLAWYPTHINIAPDDHLGDKKTVLKITILVFCQTKIAQNMTFLSSKIKLEIHREKLHDRGEILKKAIERYHHHLHEKQTYSEICSGRLLRNIT